LIYYKNERALKGDAHYVMIEMPKYCKHCGTKLEDAEAKFCPECGKPLTSNLAHKTVPAKTEEKLNLAEDKSVIAKHNVEKGEAFERAVEDILKNMGYKTEWRETLPGNSGHPAHFDIIARKGNQIKVVECKNRTDIVDVDIIRSLADRMHDSGVVNGIFAAYRGLTKGATEYAEYNRIIVWAHDWLASKHLAILTGRTAEDQFTYLENVLPLKTTFHEATVLDFINKEEITFESVDLFYYPYFKVKYHFNARFKDPTRKEHVYKDSGTLFIDAVEGKLLNQLPPDVLKILTKKIKNLLSSKARLESFRDKKLLEELEKNPPIKKEAVNISGDCTISRVKPDVPMKSVSDACIEFITKLNTHEVEYTPKHAEDSLFSARSVTFTPKRNDIKLEEPQIVYLPRWSIMLDALGKAYQKEILACSGQVLEDNLSYCPKHYKLGGFFTPKKATIICEVCGENRCEDHISKCVTCGKWLCKEHAIICSACGQAYCKEHCTFPCPICGKPVCPACIVTCPDCGKAYGKNHTVTCNNCEKSLCSACTTTSGLIFKKRLCKNCSH